MKSEWKEYTLDEVCERIFSGGTPSTMHSEYWNGTLKWLSSGETSQRFIYDTERKITEIGVKNSSTKLATKGCTVIATAGQGFTRGQASFLMTDTFLNQSVIACKANERFVLPLFLYYNLDNRYEEFRLLSDGTSTRGGLSGWILKRMTILLPPLDEQKKIVDILEKIDRKIEVNNAINHNLQQQARAIYREWFVDFTPNGGIMPTDWKLGRLKDILRLKRNAIKVGDEPLLPYLPIDVTDVSEAYRQLRNYMIEIPTMFVYNAICVMSDHLTSKAGTITAGEDRFMEWKTKDGSYEDTQEAKFDTFFEGMFEQERLLDIIKNFICFSNDGLERIKILAAYHQYFAVKKAIESTKKAIVTDGKGGVFWHTQGSGKSLSMVF